MRIRNDLDRLRSMMITHQGETDHYGEMMKNFYRTEKARFPLADYTGITLRAWLPKRRAILRRLAEAVGQFPAKKVPLNAKVTRRRDRGSYTIEGVRFNSRANWPVSALLYLPKKAAKPLPAVVVVHGHNYAQKGSTVYQKVAVHYVKNGYAVLAVDFVGGGERLAQQHVSTYMFAAGQTVMSIMVWDNMRAVDYLLTRPEIDGRKIGITGSSGGGNQTAFTAVFDERIAVAAPVNAVTMFDEHMAVGCDNYCPCEIIPGIWTFAEYSDLLATVAPRPLLLVNAVKDRLFPIKGAREVYHRAHEVYKAFDAADSIDIAEDYGPHSYSSASRIAILRFFDRHLKGVAPGAWEDYEDYITVEDERSEILHAFPGGKLPAGSDTLATLYGKMTTDMPAVKRPKSKRAYGTYRRRVRSHVTKLIGSADEAPLDVEHFPPQTASWGVLKPFAFQSERGIIIPSVLVEPAGAGASCVVIHTHPDGKAATVGRRLTERLVCAGAAVLAIDLRATGETANYVPSETSGGEGFVINRSVMLGRHISMMRAWDIKRALDCLRTLAGYAKMPVYLHSELHTSMAGLFAFATDERIKRFAAGELLVTFKSSRGFTQDNWVFPPGILAGADVSDIIAASLDRAVLLVRPGLPTGPAAAKDILKILQPAASAAKLTGAAAPEVFCGGFEEADRRILEFLTK